MPPGEARVLASTPIVFEGTHAPLIAAEVGGVEAMFVLDTGSEVHLLTKEHADLAGLELVPGEEGTDHSGTVMPSWSVEDVTMRFGNEELVLSGVVAIPAPAPFPARGIGGIVSPQHLHPDAMVVIDMVRDELLFVDGDDIAVAALLASRRPEATTLALERPPDYSSVVVRAAVKPFAAVPTVLNTGGRHTEFDRRVVPELASGEDERLGGGVSGADVRGVKVDSQVLVVGGHELPVASLAVRDSVPDPPGLVGMDVLRGTVLACATDLDRQVLWQVS